MSSVRSEGAQAYLGRRCVAWRSGDQPWQWQQVDGIDAGVAAVAAALTADPAVCKPAVALWLAGSLARPFIVPPAPGLRRWTEARRLAEALAPDETGLAGPCEVWLDAAPPGHAVLGVAVETATRDAIERVLAAHGVRSTAMRPWWTTAIARALDGQAAVSRIVVAEPESLVVLAGRNAVFSAAATCAPLPSPERAAAWLQRTVLSLGIADGEGVRVGLSSGSGLTDAVMEPWA
ncbi:MULTISPECIES: hypothetical protein [unclassified Rhizobacter]|uniref:hypothetical protein n=1 Tax=unclassified Rhizobacter TaxID=2640088 RepID=UPI0006F6639D|nr:MULTISPECIES: hypothetical protein [unclassified Rhizobacter]KQU65053.1 hypothetical protein ASC88_11720 [Rhizobacter sp. Root29]KQW02769.1 hypothetical protein ASC98_28040 [Rhizobacter sp. Root1238]KRB15587.1 hypothetical protein ASE08_27015 [Rhizobacter sp. Root16D2]